MNGINYLDKDFAEKLKEPPGCRINDESTSALARVWQVFEKTGTSTWPSETVEWFLVYLMTEVSATPHSISQGYNAPSLPQAYEAVALDLVSIPIVTKSLSVANPRVPPRNAEGSRNSGGTHP
jgi:hypothetical protein